MYPRPTWRDLIEDAWRRKNIVWLMGVRRTGKTVLCRSLDSIEYFDCELPSSRRSVEDPESFLRLMSGRRVVLDEVHRLSNPSELLKIAADHHPGVRIVATGSSTLGASRRFRDTLAGRKAEVWLTPMTMDDTRQFGRPDLEHRLLHGGLPEFFLAERPDERRFQELMDAYWARDVMELFRLERRHSFARFAEILMLQSGGVFEATRFTRPCEVSRPTITNYLALLEATFVVHVVRPFSGNPSREIVAAPKVYWFDTGFVCAWRGWDRLRPEDVGVLWEHFVLNEMHARLQSRGVRYWRSKHGNEVDFVLSMPGRPPVAIECKRSSGDFDPRHLLAFRSLYPGGQNLVVATDVSRRYARSYRGMDVTFVDLDGLFDVLNRGHS